MSANRPAQMDQAALERERRGAAWVVRTLRKKGHEAYFVGGSVRDALLKRPVKEYDIATSATPDEVMACFKRTVPVGVQFGVVIVVARDGEYEVATFRAEASYTDGRRPDNVRFVNAREDVLRRDFTINGLLQDPDTGEIRDFVDGKRDLDAQLIRAIGTPMERFEEDHLRILRAIRFSATLGFDIETHTFDAITRMAHTVDRVAVERIATELRRTFSEGDPVRGYTLLLLTGVLPVVLPEIDLTQTSKTAAALHTLGAAPFPDVLAVLLPEVADDGAQVAIELAERLRLSKDDREALRYFVRHRARPEACRSLAERLRFVREAHFDAFARVELARRVAADRPTRVVRDLVALKTTTGKDALRPEPLLTGRDLKAMGLRPSPHFKIMLHELEDAQLEGRVTTRPEAVALIEALAKTPP